MSPPRSTWWSTVPRHAVLAPHLREAAAIGAISDLHMIASTLAFGDALDAALSRRISDTGREL